MSNNNQKIPCGGFYLGDGLTMEGNTLKSLGGAYIKVNTNDGETFEFMDDSPLKTFEEIKQKMETSLVTLLECFHNVVFGSLSFEGVSKDSISFYKLFMGGNELSIRILFINSDNTITSTISNYPLTPAT